MSQIQNKFLANDAVTAAKIANGTITDAKLAAGIDAVKIGAGDVSNTEFGYLDGVTSAIQTQLGAKISSSEKGAASGVATLDGGGKIPASQLPNSVMEFQGTWNASTNSPALADGTGNAGDVYRVSVAGSQDLGSGSLTYAIGDWVMYSGTIWQKSQNSDIVSGSTPKKETFTLSAGDITNQYIDLTQVSKTDAIHFVVKGGAPTLEGASHDYSVSYTGGAGGKTRITFLNDLATGGNAALVAADIVQVVYSY